jgi:uncharacterized cofD-like protein
MNNVRIPIPATPARVPAPAVAAESPWFPRIVALGGGTGLPVVLRGLADVLQRHAAGSGTAFPTDLLGAIVTVTDDGGSSGRLRRDLGVLPPGDIRNCLAALSGDSEFNRLLQHRFDARTDLGGHPVGNLMLAALTQMTGSFVVAIDEMARLLAARGRVYPPAKFSREKPPSPPTPPLFAASHLPGRCGPGPMPCAP